MKSGPQPVKKPNLPKLTPAMGMPESFTISRAFKKVPSPPYGHQKICSGRELSILPQNGKCHIATLREVQVFM